MHCFALESRPLPVEDDSDVHSCVDRVSSGKNSLSDLQFGGGLISEMQLKADAQLIRAYAEQGDEAAFREFVHRHMDLVYSAALRQLGSSDLAHDVAQNVFTDIARKATSLVQRVDENASLVGWLYRGARFEALTLIRSETRRVVREREAMEQSNPTHDAAPTWEEVSVVLDDAMAELNDVDREAVLLRFFKQQDLREIGRALGISDDAAQKRVSRALDKLREILSRRGVAIGTGALITIITANAVQAAPTGLALTVSSAVVAGGTIIGTAAATTAAKAIVMTTFQKTMIAAAVVIALSAAVYEGYDAARARDEVLLANREKAPLTVKIQQLTHERDDALAQLAEVQRQVAELSNRTAEIHKLRGEVVRLQQVARENSEGNSGPSTKAWKDRIQVLIQKLRDMPEQAIPELQFLTDKDWANVGWDADVTTDDGLREAFSKLREEAQNIFKNRLRTAIQDYAAAHDGRLPDDITDLQSWFKPPVKDAEAMLKRWKLLQTGKLSSDPSKPLARNIAYADRDYDSDHQLMINGAGGGRFNHISEMVENAAVRYSREHGGLVPMDASQLTPYLMRTIEPAAVQRYLDRINANGGLRNSQPPEISEAVNKLEAVIQAYSAANNGLKPTNLSGLKPFLTTPEEQAAYDVLDRSEKKAGR